MQVNIPQIDLDSTLVINQAIADSPETGHLSITLDIDLFSVSTLRFDIGHSLDDEWAVLERFHERKNEVFEASITEETRKLIS